MKADNVLMDYLWNTASIISETEQLSTICYLLRFKPIPDTGFRISHYTGFIFPWNCKISSANKKKIVIAPSLKPGITPDKWNFQNSNAFWID